MSSTSATHPATQADLRNEIVELEHVKSVQRLNDKGIGTFDVWFGKLSEKWSRAHKPLVFPVLPIAEIRSFVLVFNYDALFLNVHI
jgi:hypothetical protein